MAENRFAKLLEPGFIGPVKTRNRIIKSGATMFLFHDEEVTEEARAYYERFAIGGVGLVIVEAVTVDYPYGARFPNRYRLDDDKYIEGMKRLTEAMHRHDCPTFVAMNHDGPWQVHWYGRAFYDGPPIGASPVSLKNPRDHHNEVPRALTIPEIEDIVQKFANAVMRAKKAGFDGVDINAASSHLFHNFLSPFWNRREDIYGGSVENRARLIMQVIQESKRLVGKDFPISVIINAFEVGRAIGIDDKKCLTLDDSRAVAKLVEKAGADAIQVRSHWLGWHVAGWLTDVLFYPEPPIPVEDFPKEYNASQKGAGANLFVAREIKRLLSIPVTVVGRMDPDLGEKALEKGFADFIAMTRRLHADPELPNKLAQGRPEDIAPCTGCDSCLGLMGGCRINPLSGTTYLSIEKAAKKKKVMVIGGGPSGMEAAYVSAVRGHDVSLYEKSRRLGGLLPVAAIVKGNHPENLPLLIEYFERQMEKLKVKVYLGEEADPSTVEREKPDVVFLAQGGTPTVPVIPGINRPNVVAGGELHRRLKSLLRFFGPDMLRSLTKLYMPIGKRVVIIGGGIQGCELGEFLTKRGRKVTIVEKDDTMGQGLPMVMAEHLFAWFEKKGVVLIPGVKEYVEITDKGLTIIDREGKKRTIEADTIVPALPLTRNTALLERLKGKTPEVYALGDCQEPGLIVDAVKTAFQNARDK
jgi:2,4-dienoyl-CoA reductase (NADPH2)